MESFILDTNLFFNIGAGLEMGKNTEEIVVKLTETIKKLKKNSKANFYMPPRVVDEFLSFFEDKEQGFIKNFLSVVDIKSPNSSGADFSSKIFYQLIEDIRNRSYRGLNIAEEEIIKAGEMTSGKKYESKKDFQIEIGKFIKNFRNRYRNATRTGFLDSVADLDLIVLSKEVNGFLVTSDEGVLSWGRSFGIKEMPASVFQKRLEDLLL
ncbi:RNA ligase partner protein [Candidatus Roizmanbacteria bacterium CG_4_9_14_3_um_filter_33_18]|uniref:RNA ligase partner protein n=3 Tax=Candidatus Roizmaniibacteriota TaxID=1752723 RepID=A0A2M7U9V3_9BACT|nr:MAG: RNA ligase partner protein [Candidatus Roizmanbacteria bacterium CG22_combo_CG10-13_8_21_14_all_34_12]PIZ67982.1 MAG: RNA ligase partner protein [Candidatus Roizmanbacteria bacterium CG_4_10_14_0_2_um_filter_33_96]PJA55223.1 MAG: RNA ligase partner protein [Candidatus Roizmanbacteria bacterium CG_4_9_14_3_um_filter_33_18]